MSDLKISFVEPIEVKNKSISSIELKRNSKGGTEIVVKIYNGDPKVAMKDAQKIYDDLDKKYR